MMNGQTVSIRRDGRVFESVPVKWLVPSIQRGKLLATDELSRDGQHWVALGRHSQLKDYFPAENGEDETLAVPPPDIDVKLSDLAQMLKDINGA